MEDQHRPPSPDHPHSPESKVPEHNGTEHKGTEHKVTARRLPPRPLRSQVPRSHGHEPDAERASTLHMRGVRILRDGTVAAAKTRFRQSPPIRLVRRKPPLRLPLAPAHRRLHAMLIVVAMALSLCAGRLLQLQGFDSSSYTIDALTRTLPLLPARGAITDRNGLVLAATQPAVAVTADPKLTAPDAAQIADILASHLGMSQT
jgi:cell division protein FtsI (penicillin-binding protein 3)